MTFDYYTGSQAEQFSFIRIPKLLLLHETFSSLSIQAKLLYAVLLDRMSLSVKNHWVDSKNRAYIIVIFLRINSRRPQNSPMRCHTEGTA